MSYLLEKGFAQVKTNVYFFRYEENMSRGAASCSKVVQLLRDDNTRSGLKIIGLWDPVLNVAYQKSAQQ